MADENDRPPLARRVPGATQAGPADPERRKPPDLPEEFLQRIQAVVSAAHAQAARDLEAQQQRGGQPDRSGRNRSSTRTARRGSTQAGGSKSPNGPLQSVVPNLWRKRQGGLSDQDAEFDTAPIPRLTASGTIATPGAPATDAQPTDSAESNGGAGTGQTNGRAPITRQERGAQHKRSSRQTGTQYQRPAAQLRARQEEERGAQTERERVAVEERARQEQERAAQERAKQERERAAQLERERAAEEQARQQRERHAKREQKRTSRQERAAERVRAAESKRIARQELAGALQERAREEQKRVAQLEQERARQEEQQAAEERIRLEQELEDRQWAAQRRARQEREREEAEARARLQQHEDTEARTREEAEARTREEAERAAQAEQERTRLEKQRKEAEERAREQAEKRAREEQERATQLEQESARQEQQRKEAEERAREEAEARTREEAERAAQAEQERTRLEKQRKEAEERARQEREREEAERAAQAEQERTRLEKQRKEAEERARQERERERTQKQAPAAAEAEHPEDLDSVAGPATGPKRAMKPTASPEQAEKPGERKVAATVLTAPDQVAQPKPSERTGLRRYRVPAAIAAAVALLAAGSLIVAQSLHTSTHKSLTSAQISAAVRNQAAAWVAQQIDTTAIVSCDPMMCRALTARGVPARDLHELEPSAATPLGSQVVVATAAIRNQFGSRLNSVYAPAVIASFGSGKARIDVRMIAPDGAAAFWSQFRADQRERKTNGTALLTTGSMTTSTPAREQLTAGQVDSRLIVLLSFLAPAFRLDVVAFGDSRRSATAGMPLRSLTLTGGKANLRSILVYVRTHETAPYIPEYTQMTQRDGRPELLIEFSAPSPLGVFSPPNP